MQGDEKYITKYVDNIRLRARFLEQRGFSVVEVSEFIIEYSCKDCCLIGIYYGRYSDEADIYIRFETKPPENYDLSWFRILNEFEEGDNVFGKVEKEDKLTRIYNLLKYLEEHFEEVTDLYFCRNIRRKIHDNFEKGVWDTPKFAE